MNLMYGVFPSPLGNILIARSGEGVAGVEFLGSRGTRDSSSPSRLNGYGLVKDGANLREFHNGLREYLQGKRTRLGWPLDRRLVKSEFHRDVLRVTEQIPYGAVMTYKGVAEAIGRPRAVRAVAQALRWNPLPIAIPCHRVIGASGHLTGYAGSKGIRIKEKLLTLEGIPLQRFPTGPTIRRDRMYVGWRKKNVYCLPTCPDLARITPGNMILLGSRPTAASTHFSPCPTCRPQKHSPSPTS